MYDGGQTVLRFSGDALFDRYLWGPAVDQLLADEQIDNLFGTVDDQTLWALTDRQGTVRDIVDNNGIVRKHTAYDAFGKIQGQQWYDEAGEIIVGTQPYDHSEAVDQVFYYTGRLLDRTTGLQNNLNRWYDPGLGRWLSEDPIGLGPDANPYRYVGNSPTTETDPQGLVATTAGGVIAGGAIEGVGAAAGGIATGLAGGAAIGATGYCSYRFGRWASQYTTVPLVNWWYGNKPPVLPVAGNNNSGNYHDRLQEALNGFRNNPDFRRWWHDEYGGEKIGGGGIDNPDLPVDDILEGWEEWNESGRPKPK